MRLLIEPMTVRFGGGEQLQFAGVDHCFSAAPLAVVSGGNGAGKTTLLNLLSGHCAPIEGAASLDGDVITGGGVSHAREAGVLRSFQSPLLCAELEVWKNVALPLLASGWSDARRLRDAVVDRLNDQGLIGTADRSPLELSWGQRRLVELLRIQSSFSRKVPRLLLLDEPLAGLDAHRRRAAIELTREMLRQGCGVLLVAHGGTPPELRDVPGRDLELRIDASGTRMLAAERRGAARL